MRSRRRSVAAIAVLAFITAACTGDGIRLQIDTATPTPSALAGDGGPGLRVEPVKTGEATSKGAMRALCVSPTPVSTGDGSSPGPTPPEISEVEDQVEAVRGLEYLDPVVADPVSADEIADDMTSAFDDTYPKAFYDRRTVAWQTIGVIPTDVTIRDAMLAFQTGQVVGFYNPVDGQLVYLGDDGDLDLTERYTLAHELTHAMDDQHFDLSRLDAITAACRDEAFQGALGAVEGSAEFFAMQVLTQFPDPDAGLGDIGGAGLPAGVPPFITELTLWPYSAGVAFMSALDARGGLTDIDGALTDLPPTTEQVMHPELYPQPAPEAPDIADRSAVLGPGWGDLDVMQVGEEWLRAMLRLALDPGDSADAAAGWNGGTYRAWTDGRDTAVLLKTSWDTPDDAAVFADAMDAWLTATGRTGSVDPVEGETVTVGFATTEESLAAVMGTPNP